MDDTSIKKMELESGSGDYTMDGTFGDANITTSSGNVNIDNARTANQFGFDIECGSGDIKINNKNKGDNYHTAGEIIFKVQTGSGNVTLYFGMDK